jgi:hypothetical protein
MAMFVGTMLDLNDRYRLNDHAPDSRRLSASAG